MAAGDDLENTASDKKSTSTNPYLLWKSDAVKQRLLRLKHARFPTQCPKLQASRGPHSDRLGAKKEAMPTLRRGKMDEKRSGEFPRLQRHFSVEAAKNSISMRRESQVQSLRRDSGATDYFDLRRPYQGLDKPCSSFNEKAAPRWMEGENEKWKQLQATLLDNGSITCSSSDISDESSSENDNENSVDDSGSVSHASTSDDNSVTTDKNGAKAGTKEDAQENVQNYLTYPTLMEMRALTQSVAVNAGLEHMECYTLPDSECDSGSNTPRRGSSQENPDTLSVHFKVKSNNASGGLETMGKKPSRGHVDAKSSFEERGTGIHSKYSDSNPGEIFIDDERNTIFNGLNVNNKGTTGTHKRIMEGRETTHQSLDEEDMKSTEWNHTQTGKEGTSENGEETRGIRKKHEIGPIRCKRTMIMNTEMSENDREDSYGCNRETSLADNCTKKVLTEKRAGVHCQSVKRIIKNASSELLEGFGDSCRTFLDTEYSDSTPSPTLVHSSNITDNCYHGYVNDTLSIETAGHKDECPEKQTWNNDEDENIGDNNEGMAVTQIYKEAAQNRTFNNTDGQSTSTGSSNQASPGWEEPGSTGQGDLNAEQEVGSHYPVKRTLSVVSQRLNTCSDKGVTHFTQIQKNHGQLLQCTAGAGDTFGDFNNTRTQGHNGTGYYDTPEITTGEKEKIAITNTSNTVALKPTRAGSADNAEGLSKNKARESEGFNIHNYLLALDVSATGDTGAEESKVLDDCSTKADCPLRSKYEALAVNSDKPTETFDIRDLYKEAKLVHSSPPAKLEDEEKDKNASEPLEEYDLDKLYKAASQAAVTSVLGDLPGELAQKMQSKPMPTILDGSLDGGSKGQSTIMNDENVLPDEFATCTRAPGLTLNDEPEERCKENKEQFENPGLGCSGNVMEVEEIQDNILPQPIEKIAVCCKGRNVAARDPSVAAWRSPTAASSAECQHGESGAMTTLKETDHMVKSSLRSEKHAQTQESTQGSSLSGSTSLHDVSKVQQGRNEHCSLYKESKPMTGVENNAIGTTAQHFFDRVNSTVIEKERDSASCSENACSPTILNEKTSDQLSVSDTKHERAPFQNSESIQAVDEACDIASTGKQQTRQYDFDDKNGSSHENMDSKTQLNDQLTQDAQQSINDLNPDGHDRVMSPQEFDFDTNFIHRLPSPECPCTSLISETSHKMLGTTRDQLPQLKHSYCVQTAPSARSSDETLAQISSSAGNDCNGIASLDSLHEANTNKAMMLSDQNVNTANDCESSMSISSADSSDDDVTGKDSTREFNVAARKKRFEQYLASRTVAKVLPAKQTQIESVPTKTQLVAEVVNRKKSTVKTMNQASGTKSPFACLIMGSKITVGKKAVNHNRSSIRESSAEVNQINREKKTNVKLYAFVKNSTRLQTKENRVLQPEWNSRNKKAVVFKERKTEVAKTVVPKTAEASKVTHTTQNPKKSATSAAKVRDSGKGDALGTFKQTACACKPTVKGKGDIPVTKCDRTVFKNSGERTQQLRERTSLSLHTSAKDKKANSCTVLQAKNKNTILRAKKDSTESKASSPDLARTCISKQGVINIENKMQNDKTASHKRCSDLESATPRLENGGKKKNEFSKYTDVSLVQAKHTRMIGSPDSEMRRQQRKTPRNSLHEKDSPTHQRQKLFDSVLKRTRNSARKGVVTSERKRLPKLQSPTAGSNGNNSSSAPYKSLMANAKARAIERINKSLWAISPRSPSFCTTHARETRGTDIICSPASQPEATRIRTDSTNSVKMEEISCTGGNLQLPALFTSSSIARTCSSEAQKEEACYRKTQLSRTCPEQTIEKPECDFNKHKAPICPKPFTRFPELRTATCSSSKHKGIGKQILLASNEMDTTFTKFPLLSEKENGLYTIQDNNSPTGDENVNNSTTRSGSSSPDDNMGSVDLPSHQKELYSVYKHDDVQIVMDEAKELTTILSVSEPVEVCDKGSLERHTKKSRIPIRKPPSKKTHCGERRFIPVGEGRINKHAVNTDTEEKTPLEQMQKNVVSLKSVMAKRNTNALQKPHGAKTIPRQRVEVIQQEHNPKLRERVDTSPLMRAPLPERLKKYQKPKIPAHMTHRMLKRKTLHKKLTVNDDLVPGSAKVTPCSPLPGEKITGHAKLTSGKSMPTVPFVKLGPCKQKSPGANEDRNPKLYSNRFTSCVHNSPHSNTTGLNQGSPADKEQGKHADSKLKSTCAKKWTSYYASARASHRIDRAYRRASSQASYKYQTSGLLPRSPEPCSCLVHVRTPVGFVKYVHRPALSVQERNGAKSSCQEEQRHLLSRCELFSTSSKSSLGKTSDMSDIESLQTQNATSQQDGDSHELDFKKESVQNIGEETKTRVSVHDVNIEEKDDASSAGSVSHRKVNRSISNSWRSHVTGKDRVQSTYSLTVSNHSKTLPECQNSETADRRTCTHKTPCQTSAVHVHKVTNEVRSKVSSPTLTSGSDTESDLNGTISSTSFAILSKGSDQHPHFTTENSVKLPSQINVPPQKEDIKVFSKLAGDNGTIITKTHTDFGPIPSSISPRVNLRPERQKESVGEKLTLTSAESQATTGRESTIHGTKQNHHRIFKPPTGTLCFAANTIIVPGMPSSLRKPDTFGKDNCSFQQNTPLAVAENQSVQRNNANLEAERNDKTGDVKDVDVDVEHDRLSEKDSKSNEIAPKHSQLYEFQSQVKPSRHESAPMSTEADTFPTTSSQTKRTRFTDGVQDSEFGESESTTSLVRAEYSRTRYRPLEALITHNDFVEYAQELCATSDDDTLSTAEPQNQHVTNRPKRGRLTVATASVQPRWSAEAVAASRESLVGVSYEYEPEEEGCVETERGDDTTSEFDDIQDESCNHVKSEEAATGSSATCTQGKKKSMNVVHQESCPLPPLSKRQAGRPHRLNVKRHY